jgi:hypothetical protein
MSVGSATGSRFALQEEEEEEGAFQSKISEQKEGARIRSYCGGTQGASAEAEGTTN